VSPRLQLPCSVLPPALLLLRPVLPSSLKSEAEALLPVSLQCGSPVCATLGVWVAVESLAVLCKDPAVAGCMPSACVFKTAPDRAAPRHSRLLPGDLRIDLFGTQHSRHTLSACQQLTVAHSLQPHQSVCRLCRCLRVNANTSGSC
jgi:hypothetical protein